MRTEKILSIGRLGNEFKIAVERDLSNYDISVDYFETIDQKTVNKYKALACFTPPPDLDLSHIKWIHSFGAGVNPMINHPRLNPDVVISRTIGFLGQKLAEYCICYLLKEFQKVADCMQQQKNKVWKQSDKIDMFNSSIAILGTGEMGRIIAENLSRLGCTVYGINSSGKQTSEFTKCYKFDDFVKAPPEINALISILPSTKGTAGLLKEEFFYNLSNIHFINVGRGDVIDESVILNLISSGKIRHATLDVFTYEPLSSESQLWGNEQVTITPHQAALTDINDIAISFRETLEAKIQGSYNKHFANLKKGY